MSVGLVHGNPETPIIWEPLVAALGRSDVHTPQLPGFGRPTPVGFGATKEEYAALLIGELESIVASDGPVDLVGHDWGGLLSMGAVGARPDLVRSWVSDVLGLFHEDYVRHDFAQIWQTPGAGEQFFEQTKDSEGRLAAGCFAAASSVEAPSPASSRRRTIRAHRGC